MQDEIVICEWFARHGLQHNRQVSNSGQIVSKIATQYATCVQFLP